MNLSQVTKMAEEYADSLPINDRFTVLEASKVRSFIIDAFSDAYYKGQKWGFQEGFNACQDLITSS